MASKTVPPTACDQVKLSSHFSEHWRRIFPRWQEHLLNVFPFCWWPLGRLEMALALSGSWLGCGHGVVSGQWERAGSGLILLYHGDVAIDGHSVVSSSAL